MNTKCCVPLTCTLLSLCLAFNIVWLWLLLYLVMGSFPLQGLGLWRIETKKIDLRKTVLCWNCETLQPSCGDTCQISTWFKWSKQNISVYKIKYVFEGEINKMSFNNPHSGLSIRYAWYLHADKPHIQGFPQSMHNTYMHMSSISWTSHKDPICFTGFGNFW